MVGVHQPALQQRAVRRPRRTAGRSTPPAGRAAPAPGSRRRRRRVTAGTPSGSTTRGSEQQRRRAARARDAGRAGPRRRGRTGTRAGARPGRRRARPPTPRAPAEGRQHEVRDHRLDREQQHGADQHRQREQGDDPGSTRGSPSSVAALMRARSVRCAGRPTVWPAPRRSCGARAAQRGEARRVLGLDVHDRASRTRTKARARRDRAVVRADHDVLHPPRHAPEVVAVPESKPNRGAPRARAPACAARGQDLDVPRPWRRTRRRGCAAPGRGRPPAPPDEARLQLLELQREVQDLASLAVAGPSMPCANAGAAGRTPQERDAEELARVQASSSRARSIAVPDASRSPSARAARTRPASCAAATLCLASTAWIESATASSPALRSGPADQVRGRRSSSSANAISDAFAGRRPSGAGATGRRRVAMLRVSVATWSASWAANPLQQPRAHRVAVAPGPPGRRNRPPELEGQRLVQAAMSSGLTPGGAARRRLLGTAPPRAPWRRPPRTAAGTRGADARAASL